jgi:hypothetical protein
LVATFFAVILTVTTWSPGMNVRYVVTEVAADAVTVIVVPMPGLCVPAAGLTVTWAVLAATDTDQCTVAP